MYASQPAAPSLHAQVRVGRALLAPDGRLADADATFLALLGRPRHELLNSPPSAALARFEPPVEPLVQRALAGEAVADVVLRERGGQRWMLSLAPVCSRLGAVLGVDLELRPWVAPSPEGLILPPDVAASLDMLRGELASSDEPFRSSFEQASVGMILVGPQGGLVRVNSGFCAIVGYSADELLVARSHDLTHPDDLAADREQIRRLFANEPAPPIEKRYRHRDGHYVWTRVSRSLITGAGGELRFGLIVVQDISVERQMREALERGEQLMRSIWEQAVFGVLLGDRNGTISYANPALARMLGYSVAELCDGVRRWNDLTAPEFHPRDAEAVAQLGRTGACQPYEKAFIARDGRHVPVLVGATIIQNTPGAPKVAAAFVTDLTPLKAAEAERAELLRIAERARAAAEASAERAVSMLALTAALSRALTPERVAEVLLERSAAIFGADAGCVTLLDQAGGELLLIGARGFSDEVRASWARFPLATATPLADAARRGDPIWLASPADRDREYPHLTHEHPTYGARAWAALPLRLDQQVIGALGLTFATERAFELDDRTSLMTIAGLGAQAMERARLSTAERAALNAADEALAMLDMVVDSAPIGMAYVDHEFRYRRINPQLAAMNGLPVAEHLGRRARDLFPKGARAWEPHWRRVIETGEPVTGMVMSAPVPSGEIYHAQVDFYPVRVGDGPVLGVGILVVDITEQRRGEEERARLLAVAEAARAAAEEAQARAEEALQLRDAFLSVAAHELKTPLTSLLGQAQLLERRLAKEGLLTELNARSLQVVVGQARRLSHLIGDLLDGAHLELGQLAIRQRPVELGRLVRQLVDELQPTSPGHTLLFEPPAEGVVASADPVRVEQVVQNLLSNAVKYSPRGSTVRVELRKVDGRALLAVHDQGVGIPPEALPHLFERFFRVASPETSSVSGVGVGLYVVREIVRLHGGDVHVASQVGTGSVFTIELPLAE